MSVQPIPGPGQTRTSITPLDMGTSGGCRKGIGGEFMAIGVYGQWMYADPSRKIIIVKTSADPDFMSQDYELKHVEFFRAIAGGLL